MRPRREQDYTETGERRYDDVPLSIRIGAICSCVSMTVAVTFLYQDFIDPLFARLLDIIFEQLGIGSPGSEPPP